ncbi:MAG: nitrogen fixation protein NifQ [Methylococcaceae bacterium]|nr:MAG: nitrogen fixation protein NifQ [Methylococcaceae bacterium]
MLASWCVGEGVLPDFLGLEPKQFRALQARYFKGIRITGRATSGRRPDFSRMLEREDLLGMLMAHAGTADREETHWIAGILVAGCLGDDHLWQDLGLWSRVELSGLIAHNFPTLAAKNTQDMKWKKFLYKQLCEAEGIRACRAPSCEVCVDYRVCFGPEE